MAQLHHGRIMPARTWCENETPKNYVI